VPRPAVAPIWFATRRTAKHKRGKDSNFRIYSDYVSDLAATCLVALEPLFAYTFVCLQVKLRIRERYIVQITPAFKCSGVWPRSAAHWPIPHIPWPHPNLVAEVKTEGFDLLSKESVAMQGKQSAMEGDAWVSTYHAEQSHCSR